MTGPEENAVWVTAALVADSMIAREQVVALEAERKKLKAALEPFARYALARQKIFGTESTHSYLLSTVADRKATANLTRADWEAAIEAVGGTICGE